MTDPLKLTRLVRARPAEVEAIKQSRKSSADVIEAWHKAWEEQHRQGGILREEQHGKRRMAEEDSDE